MKKVLAILFIIAALPAFAAERIVINADKLERIPSLDLVVAAGHVRIKYGGYTLEADEVRLNVKTKDLVAQGNVVLWEEGGVLRCERLEFNLDTKEGIAYEAKGYLKPFYHFSGHKIKKLSGDVYSIKEGSLTTCEVRCDKEFPDWSFKGSRVIIKREGFARIYNFTGWVKRVPVLYFPFMMFPVSTKRKTGFLIPTVGWKQDFGVFIEVPFFWAISRDKDATFWFVPYSDGSYKVASEYRQRFAEDEWLRLYGEYFDEEAETKSNKWRLKGKLFKRLPWDWELSGKMDVTSTTKYRKEFSESFQGYVERHNDSYATLVKRLDSMRFSFLFRYQDDVEEGYDERVVKLPQADWELYPVRIFDTPFYLEFKNQYLKYRKKDDTLDVDRKVSRIDLYPKVSLPWSPAPWFSLIPKYGLRYTVWSKRLNREGGEEGEFTDRVMYSFELESRGPLLYRDFLLFNSTIRHNVVPEIKYVYVPDETKAQEDIINFDEVDFMGPENKVTYSVTNRFVRLEDSKEILKFKLEQSYDILRDRRGLPYKFSDILFEADLTPDDDFSLRYRLYHSVYGFGVTKWSLAGRIKKRIKNFLPAVAVKYYYEKFTQNRYMEYNPSLKYKNVELSVHYRRDIYHSYWVERSLNLRVDGKCWSVLIGYKTLDNRLSGSRNDRVITFFIILRGLGQFGIG